MMCIDRDVQRFGRGKELVKRWRFAKDHGRRIVVIATQGVDHSSDRRDREGARLGGREIIVGAVKKHLGMLHAVGGKLRVREGCPSGIPSKQPLVRLRKGIGCTRSLLCRNAGQASRGKCVRRETDRRFFKPSPPNQAQNPRNNMYHVS
jgi:hypothetical protein